MSGWGMQRNGTSVWGVYGEDTPPAPSSVTLLQMLNPLRYGGSTFGIILMVLL